MNSENEVETIISPVPTYALLPVPAVSAGRRQCEPLTKQGLMRRPDLSNSGFKMNKLNALGLGKRDLELMKKTVMDLAEKRLNMDMRVGQQSVAWRAYLKEAATLYPQLNQYSGYWPLARYMGEKIRCRASRKELSKSSSDYSSTTRWGEKVATEESGKEYFPFSGTASKACSRTVMDCVLIPAQPKKKTAVPKQPTVIRDDYEPLRESIDSNAAFGDACPEIMLFLRGLNPDLGRLGAKFKKAGIDSGEALDAIRNWSPAWREQLFEEMCSRAWLTRFECMVILLALQK